jgi:hypothetical protein
LTKAAAAGGTWSELFRKQYRNVLRLEKEFYIMSEISTLRLYLLRAGYLVIAVGLTFMILPGIISPPENLPHMNGVVRSLLGGVCLLSFLGIRYPLKMLPLLFFELLWKIIWVVAFGLRLWAANRLDQDTSSSLFDCTSGIVLVLLVTPWDYVFKHYLRAPGDKWRKPALSR